MKKLAILSAIVFAIASAAAGQALTPAQAERNLKLAREDMARAVTAINAQLTPEKRASLVVDQAAWLKRAEAFCAPESDGQANSGSAAALEYAEETQCIAESIKARTKLIRDTTSR